MNTEFAVSTRVISGVGSLAALPAELDRLGGARIALIADRGIAEGGLLARVRRDVPDCAIAATVLVDANPDVRAVELSAAEARRADADVVLAVGGGSALGAAKAVAIRLTNDGRIDGYAGSGNVPVPPAPTIAVPTTAGSGSEVSQVLVLHEAGRPDELVVRSPGCEPRVAVLDGTVLRDLPWGPLVFAALDALSHCIESTWARRSSFFTEALAHRAAQAIIDTLPVAVDGIATGRNRSGANDDVLQRLIEASSAANMACGNSGLALVHALSTAPSVHIAHGLQNGILLPHVARFNDPVTSDRSRVLVDQIPRLYDTIGFVPRFGEGAVGGDEVRAMLAASTGHPFRLNNRKQSTDEDLAAILIAAGAREAVAA